MILYQYFVHNGCHGAIHFIGVFSGKFACRFLALYGHRVGDFF